MTEIPMLLVIDRNLVHAEAFREALLKAYDGPFHDEWVQMPSQSMERLSEKPIWENFANPSLPDSQGLDTIKKFLQAAPPSVPTLVMGDIEDEDI